MTTPTPKRYGSAPTYRRESPAVSNHRKEKRRQEKAHASRKTYRTIPPREVPDKDDDSSTIGSVISWRSYDGIPIAKVYVPLEDRSYKSSTTGSSSSKPSLDPYEEYLRTTFDPIETQKPSKTNL